MYVGVGVSKRTSLKRGDLKRHEALASLDASHGLFPQRACTHSTAVGGISLQGAVLQHVLYRAALAAPPLSFPCLEAQ